MKNRIIIRHIICISFLFLGYVKTYSQGWTQVNVGTTNDVRCLDYLNASTIFMGGGDGIIKSTDGGNNWSITPLVDQFGNSIVGSLLYDMHFFDANTGVATGLITLGNSEVILKTTNGGLNWTTVNVNNVGTWPRLLNDISFYNSTNGVAVGTNGRILRSINTGGTWTTITSGTSRELKGVGFASTTVGVIVGDQVILRTTNGGTSWTLYNYSQYNLESVHFVSSTEGYAVGNVVLKTTNGGLTWTQINTLDGVDIYAVNSDTAFIVNSGVYKSSNSGAFWGSQASVTPGTYRDIDFIDISNGYAVGDDGLVFKTSTSGEAIPQNDVGVYNVKTFDPTLCFGTYNVEVRLKNYGALPLNSVNIGWKVDGVYQGTYNWNGNLLSDSLSPYITLGTYPFSSVGQLIEAWTINPNSVTDQFIGNDSASNNFIINKLAGVYTIGGTSPDYPTFASAITALNGGMCGPVVFKVRNGTYTETLTINQNAFSSAVNTVTFESESGDSSMVILNSTGVPLTLNGADYFRFKNLTINATNNPAVVFNNGANNNELHHNSIANQSTTFDVVSGTGTVNHNIIIRNNRILNGARGVALLTPTPVYAIGIKVDSNDVSGQLTTGIMIQWAVAPEAKKNIINSISTSSTYNGIQFYACTGALKVEKNKIINLAGVSINIKNCNSTSGSEGLTVNNFCIPGGSTYYSVGLSCDNSYYQNVYFNTVNIPGGTSTITYAFQMSYSDTLNYSNIKVKNNSFSNKSGGIIYRILNNTTSANYFYYRKIFKELDNNSFYWKGFKFASIINNNEPTSVIEWISNIDKDTLSIVANPEFINSTDLHIYPNTTNVLLNGNAVPIPGIIDDFDGDLRDPSNPDIGADEFLLYSADGGMSFIESNSRICPGNNNVNLKFSNYGSTTISNLQINWKVNGILQTPFNWTGNVQNGNTSQIITVGNYNFIASNSYTIKAWTTLTGDLNSINDTLTVTILADGLSGTYTVGGAVPDYLTITAARDDLVTKGVCGPVVFNIRSGSYNERLSFPAIVGADETNTITFQSENGDSSSVNIYYSTASATIPNITLDGADYFTFQKLSFVLSNANKILYIKGRSNYNNFFNNRFVSTTNHIYSDTSVDQYNVFKYNRFENGQYAIWLKGKQYLAYYIYEDGNEISYNEFISQTNTAIYSQWQANIKIEGNKISTSALASNGIYLNEDIGYYEVNNNDIYGSFGTGINVYYCFSPKSIGGLIFNNFVSGKGSAAGSTLNSYYVKFIHNSFLIENSGSTTGRAFYTNGPAGSGIELWNNNLINKDGGHVIYAQGYTSLKFSDYNNMFTTGPKFSTDINDSTLADWRVRTNLDMNSRSFDALFNSTTDLHISNNDSIMGKGIYLPQYYLDYDNQVRKSTGPDIGADEFSPVYADLNPVAFFTPVLPLCSDDSSYVKLIVNNNSLFNVGYFQVSGTVNGTNTNNINQTFSVLLNAMSGDTIEVGPFNTLGGGNYNFSISTSAPYDTVLSNNSLVTTINFVDPIIPTISYTGSTTFCNGDSLQLTSSSASSYLWSNSEITSSIYATTSGNYILNTIDVNGCSGSDTIQITVNYVNADAGTDISICENQGQNITATGGGIYNWLPIIGLSDPNVASTFANPTITTIYVVEVISSGCSDKDTIVVNVNSNPIANAGNDAIICEGDSTLFLASGGGTYSWSPAVGLSSMNISNPYAFPTNTSAYYLTVTDINNCFDSDTIVVNVNSRPIANAGNDAIICEGDSTLFLASGGGTYSWSPSSGLSAVNISNPYAFPSNNSDYYLTVTDVNNCSDTDTIQVTVNTLPNVSFTQSPDSICLDAGILTLLGGSPIGGMYSGNGVIGNSFDPSVAGLGNHSIIYSYTDVDLCISSDTSFINVDICNSIFESSSNLGLEVSPNPFSQLTNIVFKEVINNVIINLYDMTGRIVLSNFYLESEKIILDGSTYSSGMYLLEIKCNNKILETTRIIIEH